MTDKLQKTENVANNVANEKMQLLAQVSAFELRDQLQIKDMRIRKLKEKNAELKDLLKKCQTLLYDNGFLFNPEDREKAKDLIADICEVLEW